MLEQQQRWLVNALQELYQRIIDGNGWPGTCLKARAQRPPSYPRYSGPARHTRSQPGQVLRGEP